MTKRWMVCVAAACVLAAAGCGKESGAPKAVAKPEGPVVLKVNEWSYTTGDLEKDMRQELKRVPREVQTFFSTKEGQKQFLDRVARRELLMQEAEKRKLGDSPDITEQVNNLRRELMIRSLVQEEIGSKIQVDDKEVQEYFNAHPDEFSGDQVHLKHILVPNEDQVKEVQAQLAKNVSFDELAKKYSQDTASAPKGGDLGTLSREQMLPDFAKAAFALKPNEVSAPVKTPFGFHLITLVERKKGTPLTFEQVKGQLQRRLLEQKQSERFQAWIKDLESKAKITRDDGPLPVGAAAEAPTLVQPPSSAAPAAPTPGTGKAGEK
ncbi:MAG TPA: peptidyl-prolyl cis-trans isomerase [Candidatus Baltobacteraceae bacterium]|nr:peptidyl-prolyl cis-trans isomerase [Candidatus Baltobacteraceae bacterium]